jgi:cytochrome c-type biogenesis protein CcmH/NrfG
MSNGFRCPRQFRILAASLSIVFSTSPRVFAGEPQWVEVRSPNFSVVTDAGEKRGREVAMRFEQMRAVFGALMTKSKVNLPLPLQIVAFRNGKDMRQYAPLFNGKPTEVAGLFQEGADRCFIMLDMSVENPWRVVFHEYAHQLLNGNVPGQLDPWFQEGFAEYFASIEVDGKEARVGRIPNDEYLILQHVGMMKIADLFRVRQNSHTYNENGDHRTTFYAESGMLMHYIYDNRLLPKVATYFDLEDKHVAVEEAVQQAFGMSPQQFDKALRDYVASGRFMYYPIPNPANISSNTYAAASLSDTAAKAVLADIHLHSRDYPDRALAEFQDILKSDPNSAAACRGLGYAYLEKQDFTHAAEYFNRASQLDSKDPRVHYYSALLMTRENSSGGGRDFSAMARELETSISLDPGFADSYALLAFAQASSGDTANALAAMQKAVAISPRNQNYLFNLANLYYANRQPAQTITLLQSLQVADNIELATRVAQLLAGARQMNDVLKAPAAEEALNTARPTTRDNESPVATTPVRLHSQPSKFLQGTLTNADCSAPPSALLTVVAGAKTVKIKVADLNHMVLIGADKFSCSWSRRKVAVNYRETADGEAIMISLELQ